MVAILIASDSGIQHVGEGARLYDVLAAPLLDLPR